jgi:hemerythrin-like domain-containing protein
MTATRLTDVLRAEHVDIERALVALEGMVEAAESGVEVPAAALEDFVAFCRSYADGLHHQKEEELLFPALQKAGLPRGTGPIGCMLREHDMGRDLLVRLLEVSGRLDTPDASAVADFVRLARLYLDLLRAHIQKENEVLFVMAEQVLGDEENERLLPSLRLQETRERRERDLAALEVLVAAWSREDKKDQPAADLPSATSARTAS